MNTYEKTQAAYPVDLINSELVTAMFETMAKHARSAARAHGKPTQDIRYFAKLVYNVYSVDGFTDELADTLLNWANSQFDSIYRDETNDIDARATYWTSHSTTSTREFGKLGMVVKFTGKQIKKLADNEPRFDGVDLQDKPVPKKRTASKTVDNSQAATGATNTATGQHGIDVMEKTIRDKLAATDTTAAQLLKLVAGMVPVTELDAVMLELGYISQDAASDLQDGAVKAYKAEQAAAKRRAAAKRKAVKQAA